MSILAIEFTTYRLNTDGTQHEQALYLCAVSSPWACVERLPSSTKFSGGRDACCFASREDNISITRWEAYASVLTSLYFKCFSSALGCTQSILLGKWTSPRHTECCGLHRELPSMTESFLRSRDRYCWPSAETASPLYTGSLSLCRFPW